ncbi:hypothetical protein BU24DRAFT_455183 [Aaosphaeria arxii CBS 175.79]|uniref:Uncharacterized protein n=1 Tax=Aaosphaeria arxii CBS 175.79 TaxID=1450172 RepID=A0A6A5XAC4_9PLEO|nr:uncharacterized protein BU24DRAFT_455183 [Aaosphaeria arxii CBS 175.79]KAF2010015.1 hypothetical protein BU24DRAFT_455183 [Aaosphaeria arxii CBS 175.79]
MPFLIHHPVAPGRPYLTFSTPIASDFARWRFRVDVLDPFDPRIAEIQARGEASFDNWEGRPHLAEVWRREWANNDEDSIEDVGGDANRIRCSMLTELGELVYYHTFIILKREKDDISMKIKKCMMMLHERPYRRDYVYENEGFEQDKEKQETFLLARPLGG